MADHARFDFVPSRSFQEINMITINVAVDRRDQEELVRFIGFCIDLGVKPSIVNAGWFYFTIRGFDDCQALADLLTEANFVVG